MKLRSSLVGIVGAGIVAFTCKLLYEGILAVYQSYATKLFDDSVSPYLVKSVWPRVHPVVDWLNNFWGGVATALTLAFVIERFWAWRFPQDQDQKAPIGPAELIELGRECIAVADETFRTQQQIEDGAPRQTHPPGGYKTNDEWSWAQADFGLKAHEYQRRATVQRDRAHGADLMDCLFRLRELGLTIPVFSDEVPGATGDVRAMLLPHYLTAYARFAGAMGRMLKRGDLEGARRSSRDWRQVTERGERAAS